MVPCGPGPRVYWSGDDDRDRGRPVVGKGVDVDGPPGGYSLVCVMCREDLLIVMEIFELGPSPGCLGSLSFGYGLSLGLSPSGSRGPPA